VLRGGGGDFAGGSDSDAGSERELDRALGAEEAPTPAKKPARCRRPGVPTPGARRGRPAAPRHPTLHDVV